MADKRTIGERAGNKKVPFLNSVYGNKNSYKSKIQRCKDYFKYRDDLKKCRNY